MNCHLDYCNSLFVNLLASQLFRVQRVQNNAPVLITRTSMHAHIPPVLMGLHWMPVASRIIQVASVGLPMRHWFGADGRLRKDYAPTLHRCIKKKRIGESAFGTTSPRLWNSLAADIRNSKTLNILASL